MIVVDHWPVGRGSGRSARGRIPTYSTCIDSKGLDQPAHNRILSMSVRQSAHLLVTHLVPNHPLKHGRRLFVWPRRSAQRRQLSEPDAGMTSSHLFQHAVNWLAETRAFVTLHPMSLQLHSSEHRHDAVVPIALPCYPVASTRLHMPSAAADTTATPRTESRASVSDQRCVCGPQAH